jgi:hypothetical protein
MGPYHEMIWGLLTTFVAFLLGAVWERSLHVVVNARARRFWRPLMAGRLTIVLGRFRGLPRFEASGVVGAGDNLALRDLSDYFSKIGFRRYTVFYNDQFDHPESMSESPLQGNLVLLGGPDANSVTREVLSRLHLGVEFVEVSPVVLAQVRGARPLPRGAPASGRHPARWRRRKGNAWRVPVFLDRHTERVHGPVFAGDDLRADCGVVLRCPNPFNPSKEVLILCGSYGYGTWGAVRFVQSTAFLRGLPADASAIECLLTVEVSHDMPQGVQVEFLRRATVEPLAVPLPVPRIVE